MKPTEWLGCDAQAVMPAARATRSTTSGRVASWNTTRSASHARTTSVIAVSRPAPPKRML